MDDQVINTALTSEAQPDTAAATAVDAVDAKVSTDAKPADAADVKPADGESKTDEAKADDKPAGAPEKYEAFKAPEGYEVDATLFDEFAPVLKELNLSQEQAQRVVDFAPKLIEATQARTVGAVFEQLGMADRPTWAASLKTDKEFGGDKLAENLAVANKAVQAFGSPALNAILNKTGLGNHPEMVRAFYKVGLQIKEDGFVPGGASGSGPDARRLFNASQMNP